MSILKSSLGSQSNIFSLRDDCKFDNYTNKYCEIYNFFLDTKKEKERLIEIVVKVTNFYNSHIQEIKSNLNKYKENKEEYYNYLNSTSLKNDSSNTLTINELIDMYVSLKQEGKIIFNTLQVEFEKEKNKIIQNKIIQNKQIIFI